MARLLYYKYEHNTKHIKGTSANIPNIKYLLNLGESYFHMSFIQKDKK